MAPVIEIAIALVAAFWITSLAASAAVEWFSQNVLKKRASDLDTVLGRLIDGKSASGNPGLDELKKTSVYQAMQMASSKKRGKGYDEDRMPSYMSSRSFADGVVEIMATSKKANQTVEQVIGDLPDGPLKQRMTSLYHEVGDDLLAVKAGIEGWFDDSMDRLEGAYKRWAQWVLLITGVVIAGLLNISAVNVTVNLWNDDTLRTATADQVISSLPCPEAEPDCTNDDRLDEIGLALPIGWGESARPEASAWPLLQTAVGWLITGLATMLGAPFWFNLLGRLGNLRQTRGAPPKAPDDQASAVSQRRAGQQTRSFTAALN